MMTCEITRSPCSGLAAARKQLERLKPPAWGEGGRAGCTALLLSLTCQQGRICGTLPPCGWDQGHGGRVSPEQMALWDGAQVPPSLPWASRLAVALAES